MTSYDKQMIADFGNGLVIEHLVGEGKFFKRDYTWGYHDTLRNMGTVY